MRAFVQTHDNPFWLDVLSALERRSIDTGYIVGSPAGANTFHDAARRRFPEAGYHDIYAAIRGVFSEPGFDRHALYFDAAAKRVWEESAHQVIELIGRLDARDEFSYRARLDLFREYLRFSDFLMQRFNLDTFVSAILPHDPFPYVVYRLFQERGCPTATLHLTALDGRAVPCCGSRLDQNDGVVATYRQLLAQKDRTARLSDGLAAELSRVKRDDVGALSADAQYLYDMGAQLSGRRTVDRVLNFAHAVRADVEESLGIIPPPPIPPSYLKEPGRNLATSFRGTLSRVRHARWSAGNRRRTRKLKSSYAKFVSTPSLSGPFVFVPLHYQPEYSSNPLGGPYFDQVLMLETLSAALPPGWVLIVKEHPYQHDPWNAAGCRGRRPDDYARMARVPNVFFVATATNQFELETKSRAVVTISGTAGWETLLRGKPLLCFGDAWYRPCRGVIPVADAEDCKVALARIASGEETGPSDRDVRLFAEAVETAGLRPYVGEGGEAMPWVVGGAATTERVSTVEKYAEEFATLLSRGDTQSECKRGSRAGR